MKIEAYSDSTFETKVAETASQEIPAIKDAGVRQALTFSFNAKTAASLYFKVAIEITNKTTYNGVFCLEKVTFSEE